MHECACVCVCLCVKGMQICVCVGLRRLEEDIGSLGAVGYSIRELPIVDIGI